MEVVVGVVGIGLFSLGIFMFRKFLEIFIHRKFKKQKGSSSGGQADDPFKLPPLDDHEAGRWQ